MQISVQELVIVIAEVLAVSAVLVVGGAAVIRSLTRPTRRD
jgi:hypothetical protein